MYECPCNVWVRACTATETWLITDLILDARHEQPEVLRLLLGMPSNLSYLQIGKGRNSQLLRVRLPLSLQLELERGYLGRLELVADGNLPPDLHARAVLALGERHHRRFMSWMIRMGA